MVDTIECYKVLDLEPGASAERVRHAYVELVQTWDPERYLNNPVLREQAQKKRQEIDEAYHAIRAFLPDENENERPRGPGRDFRDFEQQTVTEKSKAIMGILVAITLFALFVWALYLLTKGRHVTPDSPVPLE